MMAIRHPNDIGGLLNQYGSTDRARMEYERSIQMAQMQAGPNHGLLSGVGATLKTDEPNPVLLLLTE